MKRNKKLRDVEKILGLNVYKHLLMIPLTCSGELNPEEANVKAKKYFLNYLNDEDKVSYI